MRHGTIATVAGMKGPSRPPRSIAADSRIGPVRGNFYEIPPPNRSPVDPAPAGRPHTRVQAVESLDIQDAIAARVVDLANDLAEQNPDADRWDIADGILSGAVHWWLYANAPCGDPACENCAVYVRFKACYESGGARGVRWVRVSLRWTCWRIFSIRVGSSMQAITRSVPPHSGQDSMSTR